MTYLNTASDPAQFCQGLPFLQTHGYPYKQAVEYSSKYVGSVTKLDCNSWLGTAEHAKRNELEANVGYITDLSLK